MPPPPGNQNNEPSLGVLWVLAGIFALIWALWYVYQIQIVTFFFRWKHYEVLLLSELPWANTQALSSVMDIILNTPPAKATTEQLLYVATEIGIVLRIPVATILIIMGLRILLGDKIDQLKRIYTLDTFSKLESVNWPQIVPVIGLDLINQPIDEGPWAMAMTPMDFCKKNKLIIEEEEAANPDDLYRKSKVIAKLNVADAQRVFAQQLGPLWAGPEKLPNHVKALFAIFAARIDGNREGSIHMLDQIARSAGGKIKRPNFNGLKELLVKHQNNRLVKEVQTKHAYVITVMASLLMLSRDQGVFASADFLWLKAVDRRLWYMLNSVGRQTPYVEVAGCYAHWITELEMGRKLISAMVAEAATGLELALKDVVYKPENAKES